jgi:hypothetical protein
MSHTFPIIALVASDTSPLRHQGWIYTSGLRSGPGCSVSGIIV